MVVKAEQVAQVQLIALQVLLQLTQAVVVVVVMVRLAVLEALVVAVQVVLVRVLQLHRPVQAELHLLAVEVAVLASKATLMYQVTAVTVALAS